MIYLACLAGQLALLAVATDLLAGHAGRLGLAAVFFAALAGYTYALSNELGVNPWISMLLGLSVPWLVSVPLGRLCLNLRGEAFLLATFGLQVGLVDLVRNLDIAGGPLGLRSIGSPWPHVGSGPLEALSLVLPVLTAGVILLGRAMHPSHPIGRAYWVIRDDAMAAGADGIPTLRLLRGGFTIQACLGAVAGISWVVSDAYVGPATFDLALAILVLTIVFVSGTGGRAWWMIAGAVLVVAVSEALALVVSDPRLVGSFQRMVFNSVLIAVIVLRPRGLAGPRLETGPSAGVES